jgi:hypothetical protein
MKRQRSAAHWWNTTASRLAVLVFLLQVAPHILAAETLMFVKEWPVAEGTHVIAVFDDGAAYHSLVPNDSSAPEACANPRRISMSLLTGYDYAGVRRRGEPDFKLDAAEVAQHWRTITARPVEYVAKADATMHGNVSCTFAVVGKPTGSTERGGMVLAGDLRLCS